MDVKTASLALLKKALYGLKQAPRAWYDELSKFLLQNQFFKGTIDPTLFIRRFDDDILVAKPTDEAPQEVRKDLSYRLGTVNTGLWRKLVSMVLKETRLVRAVYREANMESLSVCCAPFLGCMVYDDGDGGVAVGGDVGVVWTLVDLHNGKRSIGTKWVFRNKKDERGIVIRNKARLVVQGYTQEKGIDYDEVFAPVARIEAIRLFFAYASFMGFIVYQIDMKSALLYGTIKEEVYLCQPPGFEDPHFPDKVYKVEKALYGLHQVPRAWYETLSTYLIKNRFRRGTIDKTLLIKKDKGDILLVQVYVDDIIFGSTKKSLCDEFEGLMHKRFQMSSMGELTFFLGLQDEEAEAVDIYLYRSMIGSLMYLTASRPDIMFVVCACARDSPFDLEAFSDSDYAEASLDRKSTTGGCQFLGRRLISWQCKKQTIVANSTTKAEYVVAANCCGHVLWIQNQMLDYGFNFMNTKIYIDNESPIYETVYKEWEDKMERVATTVSSLEAEHDSEAQTRFEAASKQSNNPPLSRVNTLGSGEDNMKLNELMELCTKLSDSFWATAKVKTVNGERQLQALVDKKKVIIIETSIRSDLNLEDAGGTDCLPTATIFEELARMGAKTNAWNEFSSTMASAIICLATNQKFNLSKYIFNAMKKQSRRKQRKDIEVSQSSASTEPMTEKETNEESVPTQSYDPSQSGEDRMQLHELMNLCTKLSDRVLALETIKTTQALEIASLKSRVKKLKKKASKRTHKFKRLYRVGSTRRVESSNDESLGAQEYTSKQERCIEDIDKDDEVSLVDETQGRSDDTEMFDTDALIGDEVFAKNDMTEKEHDVIPKEVSACKTLTTAGIKILVSTAAPSTIAVSPPVIIEVEITLGQTLAELKSAKSKVVIQDQVQSTVTTVPSTILKAKGVTFRYAGETITRTPTSVSSSSIKDKRKAKMVKPEVPLNKKDQIRLDEELARRLDAEEQEATRLERENEQEQGELTIEEKSKLFMELMNERKRHFAKLRAKEKRRKSLTKDSKEVKSSEKKAEGNRKKLIGKKRAGNEQKQESSKRQRMKDDKETDEYEEAEEDDEAEMKKHMEIVQDKEEITIDAIPLATKPPMIVEYKIVKEGQKGFYHLIRADGSSKRPEDDYERVFWGDLKVMFETDIKSEVWRSLQGYKVTV
ncbi:putative ribonuclease H-like domain-containing protein [Tanacetum coccineum]|uniref:Ribonuclease H-like domain-containing protein n=1 Tax=Tanacetum coccineum TaxID=301880 RepID=A0ABQ5J6P1_9ASTR